MYQSESWGAVRRLREQRETGRLSAALVPTVIVLGLTSLVTDISSEMVSAVLPLYLMFYQGLSPLQFGIVDGLYQGVTALMRIAGGLIADRWGRHKEVAVFGYAIAALSKLGLTFTGGSVSGVSALIAVDRLGKGVRAPARDALLSMSVPRASYGTAFGVHRMFDTLGATLGPVLAFSVLSFLPNDFTTLFVVSFFVALIGLGILVTFVHSRAPDVAGRQMPLPTREILSDILALPGFRTLLLVALALGIAPISDAFIYLGLQRSMQLEAQVFPLLYVGASLSYVVLATPMGWLADRIGRERVFLAGLVGLIPVYLILLHPIPGALGLIVPLVLVGCYYAATDGVLMALGSMLLPTSLRTTGLATLTTGLSLGRLASSLIFGAVWSWSGYEVAAGLFLGLLCLSIVVTIVGLRPFVRGAAVG